MNETDLIERAGRGDSAALRALYDAYAGVVWGAVRRLAGEERLAEDWAQEAWIKVFRSLAGFRGEARVSTWIHRIAVNVAIDGQRRREREWPAGRLDDEIDVPGPSGSDVELKVALERALDRLPDGMRQVLVLHDIEGYTHEEIGTALGVAAGTSRSQLFKARVRLRESLAPRAQHHRRTPCSI